MGFDIAIFEGPMPATNAEAMEALDALGELLEAEPTPVTPRLQALIDELKQRWPGATDEELEASPWKVWPLEEDASGTLFYTSLVWSQADAAIEIADIAIRHGLVVVDPQSETLLNPHDEPRRGLFSRRKRG